MATHILSFTCPDKPGIVYAVTGVLAHYQLTILDLQQFSDPISKTFFMRVHFGHVDDTTHLTQPLNSLGLNTAFSIHPSLLKPKVLLMVSKIGHCLNDLLYRVSNGLLNIDVPVIVSNHPDFSSLAASHGIEFHHLPVSAKDPESKAASEQKVLDLIAQHDIELVVLARYMQIISPSLCSAMSGKIINIHHSFLPSFKGAKPYHQAFDRGVKIVGATAHFVTEDLDEGPIIEQQVTTVGHALSAKDLVDRGADVETQVLASAVKWWSERRVFLNGAKTVVFK